MKRNEHQGFPSPNSDPVHIGGMCAYNPAKYGMIRGWGEDPSAKSGSFSQRPAEQAATSRRFCTHLREPVRIAGMISYNAVKCRTVPVYCSGNTAKSWVVHPHPNRGPHGVLALPRSGRVHFWIIAGYFYAPSYRRPRWVPDPDLRNPNPPEAVPPYGEVWKEAPRSSTSSWHDLLLRDVLPPVLYEPDAFGGVPPSFTIRLKKKNQQNPLPQP